MSLAIKEAWKYQLLSYPNPAVGALLLNKAGKILALNAHAKAGFAHAELLACANAFFNSLKKDEKKKLLLSSNKLAKADPTKLYNYILKNHKGFFKGSSLYISLSPCNHFGKTPPCSELLKELGFANIFISTKDPYSKGGEELLKNSGLSLQEGLLKEQGEELLSPFLKWQEGSFAFFKLALSLNASPKGKITSLRARRYAHALRAASDVLITGGTTIREDRPILDARLVGAKPPDLVILSRKHDFDPSIKALKIRGRKLYKSIPKEAKLLMYEGGEEFLKSFVKELDWLLLMNNASFNAQKAVSLKLALKPLHQGFIGKDSFTWYKILK